MGVRGHGPRISPDVDLGDWPGARRPGEASGGSGAMGPGISPERGPYFASEWVFGAMGPESAPSASLTSILWCICRVCLPCTLLGIYTTLYTRVYQYISIPRSRYCCCGSSTRRGVRGPWALAGQKPWAREECERLANIPVSRGMDARARARRARAQITDKDWIAQGSNPY